MLHILIQSIKEKLLSLKETKWLSAAVYKEMRPSCSICLEGYDQNRTMEHVECALTTCGHKYGKSCIEKNFESRKTCPKCDKAYELSNILVTYE